MVSIAKKKGISQDANATEERTDWQSDPTFPHPGRTLQRKYNLHSWN